MQIINGPALRIDAARLRIRTVSPEPSLLTHFSRMDLTLLISRTSPFRNLVMLGGIFFFIQILIEHSVSKQWSPDQKPHSVASVLGMHYLPRSH